MQQRFKSAVGALAIAVSLGGAAFAEATELDMLFEALREADTQAAQQIELRIWDEWSKSGSASMDLLLDRGREAMQAEDIDLAIEHFSALIDHAPEFAEGYNARATAYFQAGLYGPSLADIRQTLALNPRHFGAIGGLALILQEIGEPEAALEAYRAVEELYPAREGLRESIEALELQLEGSEI